MSSDMMNWGLGARHIKKLTEGPKYKAPAPLEQLAQVSDSAAGDAKKKKLRPAGRSNALLAGIANALKTRLGQ